MARATVPLTFLHSPSRVPRSLKRRSISAMVSSPMLSCERRVLRPSCEKNCSVRPMVSAIFSPSVPSVMPQTRSPYWRILLRFCSLRTVIVAGSTTARDSPCVTP